MKQLISMLLSNLFSSRWCLCLVSTAVHSLLTDSDPPMLQICRHSESLQSSLQCVPVRLDMTVADLLAMMSPSTALVSSHDGSGQQSSVK